MCASPQGLHWFQDKAPQWDATNGAKEEGVAESLVPDGVQDEATQKQDAQESASAVHVTNINHRC